MSILQGWFRKAPNDQVAHMPTLNGASDIDNVRSEISSLKRTITLTNSRQRVSKKQRDALMAKVITTLDRAEVALVRASSE